MGDNKSEIGLLVYIIPFLAVVPALYAMGWESYEASILIVAVPFMTFPVILIVGQVYNGEDFWKNKMKEGGSSHLEPLELRYPLLYGLSTTMLTHFQTSMSNRVLPSGLNGFLLISFSPITL